MVLCAVNAQVARTPRTDCLGSLALQGNSTYSPNNTLRRKSGTRPALKAKHDPQILPAVKFHRKGSFPLLFVIFLRLD
jgi:hypothetical protein